MADQTPFLMQSISSATDRAFYISPSALLQLQKLFHEEQKKDPNSASKLRIRVDTGGCSGFQYVFQIDPISTHEDYVFSYQDVRVVIDDPSFQLLTGSTLDHVQDLMGSSFVLRNPHAQTSCGCGQSFSL